MKKRSIKEQAKAAEKKILEDNADFYNDLVRQNFPAEKKSFKPKLVWISSTIMAAIILVLSLVILLPSSEDPPDGKKHYLIDNEVMCDSTISELNSNLVDITFETDNEYSIIVERVYDSYYNDTLYFHLSILNDNSFEMIDIYFYTNPQYDRQKIITGTSANVSVGDFILEYTNTIQEDSGLYTVNYTGKTEYKNTTIFIIHEQVSFSEESNFFNFFKQTIRKA